MLGDIFISLTTLASSETDGMTAVTEAAAGWELTPTSISSIIAVVASIMALIYGFIKNMQDKKKGTVELAKNGYEQLAIENSRLIADIQAIRKTADKFWILRELALQTQAGRAMVIKTEKIADDIDSAEH